MPLRLKPALAAAGRAARATGRGLKTAALAVKSFLGPADGTEPGKLHLGDLIRSAATATGFTTAAGLVAFALEFFAPYLDAALHAMGPFGVLLSLVLAFALEVARRLKQQSPAPAAPATPPAAAPTAT